MALLLATLPCASLRRGATVPIEPAPIAITTSPSRTCSTMVVPSSSTLSAKIGSTLPATRSARASARPSAATIGASPAA